MQGKTEKHMMWFSVFPAQDVVVERPAENGASFNQGCPNSKSTKNNFKDIKTSDYFYKAANWAAEKKIVAGLSDGTFGGSGKCSKKQIATFIYKCNTNVYGFGITLEK